MARLFPAVGLLSTPKVWGSLEDAVPELPDVVVYCERLAALTVGHTLRGVRLTSPFLLRTVDPPVTAATDQVVRGVRRIGKRIVWELDDALFLVIHLMIAGRLRWKKPGAKVPARGGLAAFDFDHGTLIFTEASKKKRAKLHVVRGESALVDFDRGGVEPLEITLAEFVEVMHCERHTLKRSLTDPRLFSGIGNAYSDEILFEAKLSPVQLSTNLKEDELQRLYTVTQDVLRRWTQRFRDEVGEGFPDKVTAFRPEMHVHGKHKAPCTVCGSPIQRIAYADRETNYCAQCQLGGRLLRDRAMSQLMKKDWPKTLDALEAGKARRKAVVRGEST